MGAHWLAFEGVLKSGDGHLLTKAVQIAKDSGADIFELVGKPINQMDAMETAGAVLSGGISEVSYCRFFPDDGSLGDPMGTDQLEFAYRTMRADIDFIDLLRFEGLTVKHITGPSCFMLGCDYGNYSTPHETVEDAIYFYSLVRDQVEDMQLQVNMEYLRREEDLALGGLDPIREICSELGPNFRWHGDTFHMSKRRVNWVQEILSAAEDRHGVPLLGYLHAHGHDRGLPGLQTADDLGSFDTFDGWVGLFRALDLIDYKGPLVAEPFGAVVREQIPVLGDGLPPAIEPSMYYRNTLDFLRQTSQIALERFP